MVWRARQPAKLDLWRPRRGLPPVLIACGHALYNYLWNPSQKQNFYNEMWIAIAIIVVVYAVLSAAHYAYQTLWNFVVISPADLANTKNVEAEAQSQKIKALEAKINELRDIQKVKLSASFRTEDRYTVFLMKVSSQFSAQASVEVPVSNVSLLIYNHGERPVRLRGYKLWKLEAVEATQEIDLYDVVSPSTPTAVSITEPLLRVMSGSFPYDYGSLPKTYKIRLVLIYAQDSKPTESEDQDFHITHERVSGLTIKIFAK
jgi:hypothetical protein